MQPNFYRSTDNLQKGIDQRFPIAQTQNDGARLATPAGRVERQNCGGGVRCRDAGTGFVQKVADGAIRMPSCATLRGMTPRTGHLESLKSVADPTERLSSPTPPEQSVSPPFRQAPIHLCSGYRQSQADGR